MKNKIEFISTVRGLDDLEECRPKPAKHFIPQWFKDTPIVVDKNPFSPMGSVKACPSFPDFFSQGYIIPMWSESVLHYNKQEGSWVWKSNLTNWEVHPNSQFIDHVDPYFNGEQGHFVFKADCPWRVITPPGWSVLQLPLFYHFNKNFSVLPGVIDTDIHNEINQQVLYHSKEETIVIKRGDPFVLYIPFKRKDKLDMSIRYQTEEDKILFEKHAYNYQTKFGIKGIYRQLQRQRDKDDR